MTKIIKNNAKLYITWLIVIGLISACVATTKLLAVAALGIFVVFAVFSPLHESCILLFGLMPFANIFKYEAGSTSFFTICELLVVLLSVFKCRKFKMRFVFSVLLFAAYILITSLGNFNALTIIKMLLGFVLLYLITLNGTKTSVIHIAYLMSLSTIIMLLLTKSSTYFAYIEPYLQDLNYVTGSFGQASSTMRLGGFLGDPNYCGALILMCVTLLSVLYYYKKVKMEFWVLLGLLIPLGLLTYSKSYFLCIAAFILLTVVFVLFPKHKGWAVVSVIGIIVAIPVILSGKIGIFNTILARFSEGDLTSGRAELNELYMNYLWNNPAALFFGEGITADRIANLNNVHNIYIESLFKLGITGCCLYVYVLLVSVNMRTKYTKKRKIANYIPALFLAVMYYALAGIMMYELPFYIAIAFLAIDFPLLDEDTAKQQNLEKR